MIISKEKKFIFIHIKKTAGSSITSSLKPCDDRNLFLKLLNTKSLTKIKLIRDINPFPFHAPAHQVKAYLGSQYDNYFSFAFVRNPFDWQVSNYFYIKQHNLHPRNKEVSNLSFNEYLEWTLKNNRIKSQTYFISEISDQSKLLVDFVGKFENLDEDFKKILRTIGLEQKVNLSVSNKSKRGKDYRQYYNDAAIKFIEEHYKSDLDNFGYEF